MDTTVTKIRSCLAEKKKKKEKWRGTGRTGFAVNTVSKVTGHERNFRRARGGDILSV